MKAINSFGLSTVVISL